MNPNPRRGLVAMRFNLPTREVFDLVCYGCHRGDYPARKYVQFMRRIGAFREGPSFDKLATIGVRRDELLYTANLMPPAPQGAKWDASMARDLATKGRPFFCERVDLLFMVGRQVADAFGACRELEVGETFKLTPRTLGLLIPHPSGLNRWWNDPANVLRLREQVEALTCES